MRQIKSIYPKQALQRMTGGSQDPLDVKDRCISDIIDESSLLSSNGSGGGSNKRPKLDINEF